MTAHTLTFPISGLHCGACVGRAEAALSALPGAREVRVNLANRTAQVAGVEAPLVETALAQAGYPAAPQQMSLHVPDMSCASCVARIEETAARAPGVIHARANLATHRLDVATLGDPGAVRAALDAAGYPASDADTDTAPDASDETDAMRRRFILAAALTLPVFVAEMGGHLYPPLHHGLVALFGAETLRLAQLILTALVLAGPGAGFFRRGIPGLLRARPDMDALVALGAGAAFLFSAVAVLLPNWLPPTGIYFEAAAVIVTLILLGRWLEARARGRTGEAVRRLLDLAPDTADRVTGQGTETVPLAAIEIGDVLRARPGSRIAVDGVVTDGQSPVDTAMLTGEPVPVLAGPGDVVHAGTVVTTGTLAYRATHVGRDTTLARIAALTQAAQSARLPVEAVVNRVTAWFVPAVLVVATVTFAVWLALAGIGPAVVSAVSVLIIACPCAMGLATPMSIMVGTGRAATLGALFHKGAALQRLQDARVVAFDKTGTLTQGKPALTEVETDMDRARLLRLVAGVEAGSEHPIAQALVAAADSAPEDVAGFEATAGEGARAQVNGHRVLVGNSAYLARHEVAPQPALLESAQRWAETGATPVLVAVDGVHVASLGVSDPLRDGAGAAIAALQETGRHIALISGDVPAAAQHVARILGIDTVIAGVKPEGKVAAIAALRADHGPVAFVGDGINDAPALAAADVGLAVGGATDIAVEAADVVLMSPDPWAVLRAVGMSRATLRNVWQNLVWAFGYNTLLIPVAAGVLVPLGGPQLSPQLAALAMALSSVFVVTNALRLRRWSPS
ncbi:copper-translocating P-type ATPase [uncultured Tateyamaria sp.]|uniref:heavy metal translocating P-type ATPase n=1 Tax=Tateyamaria sp. 1078 TaxID=3417464 RepID=UPI00263213D5|nr:copper-translocating P-type ATPase [uncultured Tateyamaria sp.]